MMSIHGVLGETTSYPTTYDPGVLYPIPRQIGRSDIIKASAKSQPQFDGSILQNGVDWWHAFEVSWLNPQGISQMAIARFTIPANTPNIVESKSLKLYLNSLNFTEFEDWQTVKNTIQGDLSACVDGQVKVELFDIENRALTDFAIAKPEGRCIDEALNGDDVTTLKDNNEKVVLTKDPDARLLLPSSNVQRENQQVNESSYHVYSNLLRSNCPVTNQPDWGTLEIAMQLSPDAKAVPQDADILRYVLSYRQHNGFHEQCVEQIFADLSQAFEPNSLMVRAWYTRRGGIDINPCRVSDLRLLPAPSRLVRQ